MESTEGTEKVRFPEEGQREPAQVLEPNVMDHPENFLPPSLPGETLYSHCARIASVSRTTPANASTRLLGHRQGSRQVDLLTGLRHLAHFHAQRGHELHTGELSLRLHSAVGASMPFLSPKARLELVELVQASRGVSRTRGRINIDRGRKSLGLALRRCPDCVEQDLREHGLTYWRTAHQFPGVWLCPWHARPLQWLLPARERLPAWEVAQQPVDRFREFSVEARWMEPLLLATHAIVWFANQTSLGISTLAILVRSRLRAGGLTRKENKLEDAECTRIHERVSAQLALAGVPHFPRPASPGWILRMLNDRGYSSPLAWAMLLASTLPKGRSLPLVDSGCWPTLDAVTKEVPPTLGICRPSGLDRDLARARERVPQLSLFDDRYGAHITYAPERLYTALGSGLRLGDAARVAGMSLGECERWIRRDPALQVHWHHHVATLRTEEACASIRQFTKTRPEAMRSEVLRAQNRAVRSLERYAPQLLDELLPEVQQKYSRQRFLFPGASDGQPGHGQTARGDRSDSP